MAKSQIQAGSTNVTRNVYIRSTITGMGLTGLVYNSAGLTAYYDLPASASAAITLATQTVTGAWSSGGFVEIDATNMPGWYRLDIPNAALASGTFVDIMLRGAVNMIDCPFEIDLTVTNTQSVTGGLTNVTSNVIQWSGSNVAAPNVTGVPIVDVKYSLGTISPAAAGYFAPDWGHVNAPTTVVALSGTTLADFTSTQKTSITTAATAATPTAAGVTARVTANADQIAGSATAATNLSTSAQTMQTGTAITGTLTSSVFTTNLASTVTGAYVGRFILFTSGVLIKQAQTISAYSNTGQITTIQPFTTAPSNNDLFVIV